MTKNQLINVITSLKVDLKYLKRDLQFRLDGNDVEGTNEKYKDDEHKYAAQSGVFQAMVSMDNDAFKRAMESIDQMQQDLGK
tara:strand:- start:115 stop:360 length:246 start_codon:yes stop_codon:yes gene_type:complete